MLGRLNREHDASSADVLWGSDVIWDASQVKLYMLTIRDYRRQSNALGDKQTQPITRRTSRVLMHTWCYPTFIKLSDIPKTQLKYGHLIRSKVLQCQEWNLASDFLLKPKNFIDVVLFAEKKYIFILFSGAILRNPHFVTCSFGFRSFGVVFRTSIFYRIHALYYALNSPTPFAYFVSFLHLTDTYLSTP